MATAPPSLRPSARAAGFAWRNSGTAVADGPALTLTEVKSNSLRLTAATGPQFAQADGVAALAVVTALLLGVYVEKRGAGAHVMMTTMLSSAAHALSEDMIEFEGRPPLVSCDSDFLGLGPLYRLYRASDGWVFLAAPTEKDWLSLVAVLDSRAELGDTRFSNYESRIDHTDELAQILSEMFRSRGAAEWEADLVGAGLGCVEVALAPPEGIYLGELGRSQGYVSDIEHPVFGVHPEDRTDGSLLALGDDLESRMHSGSAHRAVLDELGFGADRITALRESGVICIG